MSTPGKRISRRHFLAGGASLPLASGMLAPLWPTIARTGEIGKSYPDELLSIDAYTGGRIKTGDYITADNVDLVKELMEPAKYTQVKNMGRRLKVVPTTTDYMQLGPWEYLEATLRHQGQARFDEKQNVVTQDGKPWIGGNPFPGASTALELFAGLTLSWGRHDASVFAVKEEDVDRDGRIDYRYEAAWAEMMPVARSVMDPKPYWREHMDKLRFNSVVITSPFTEAGTSFVNVWPYDQHQFPELYGYIPEFRRVRQYPTTQRFEPLVPGSALYLSDAWAAGDPLHTWGNYRIIGRQPLLAGVSRGWNGAHPNWEHAKHGGPRGDSFFDSVVELVPEAIVTEADPVAFERAPISKKRVWFDARNQMPIAMVSYDRKGEAYKSFDGCYSLYDDGNTRFMDGQHPYWSWTYVHVYDFQSGRITRLEQVREVTGGHRTRVNDPSLYEEYLTRAAIMSLGRV
jgi:hypothetical protein